MSTSNTTRVSPHPRSPSSSTSREFDLSPEIYKLILNHITNRQDLTSLCRVSRVWRSVAERGLYNTLLLRIVPGGEVANRRTLRVCETLSTQPRIATLVEALTIEIGSQNQDDDEEESEEESEDDGDDETEENAEEVGEDDDTQDGHDVRDELLRVDKGNEDDMQGRDHDHHSPGPIDIEREVADTTPTIQQSERPIQATPDIFDPWDPLSRALRSVANLHYLNIYVHPSPQTTSSIPFRASSMSLIFMPITRTRTPFPFQLKSFHCDLDVHTSGIIPFLIHQIGIRDLFMGDYVDPSVIHGEVEIPMDMSERTPTPGRSRRQTTEIEMEDVTPIPSPQSPHTPPPDSPLTSAGISVNPSIATVSGGNGYAKPRDEPRPPLILLPPAPLVLPSPYLPSLHILETTTLQTATYLLPNNPIKRLKTCFGRWDLVGRREELNGLVDAIQRITPTTTSTVTTTSGGTKKKRKKSQVGLISLDIGDADYSSWVSAWTSRAKGKRRMDVDEDSQDDFGFGIEFLRGIVSCGVNVRSLKYLGTLVLPVDGRERLVFYSLLTPMHLPSLHTIELEISHWPFLPSTLPPAPQSSSSSSTPSSRFPSFPVLKSLASEVRLYSTNLERIVWVREFERLTMACGVDFGWRIMRSEGILPEAVWREI